MTSARRSQSADWTKSPAEPRRGTRLRPGASLERVVDILKLLAHPLRLRIIAALCERDHHVGALAVRLGVRSTTISQAVSEMRRQRLVSSTRRSGYAVYTLREQALRDLVAWAEDR
jgi:ArsR family transcriptional regulator